MVILKSLDYISITKKILDSYEFRSNQVTVMSSDDCLEINYEKYINIYIYTYLIDIDEYGTAIKQYISDKN